MQFRCFFFRGLARCCNVKIDTKNGAEAADWKAGKPVRVLRSYKLAKHSKYAPEEGVRYDGVYKVKWEDNQEVIEHRADDGSPVCRLHNGRMRDL